TALDASDGRHHCSAPHDGTAAGLPPPRVAALRRLSHQAAEARLAAAAGSSLAAARTHGAAVGRHLI
ncbi:hypothetical protein CUMW_115890, partial [Citrus unshiu]